MTTNPSILTNEERLGFRPADTGVQGIRRTFGPRGPHGDLQRNLALALQDQGYLTFTEIQINHHNLAGGDRIDVVALKPSYARLEIRAYEVKATRADLNRGLASPAWRAYRDYFHRVLFAYPAGLAKSEDIPEECGIVTQSATGWHHVRAGRSHTPPKLDHWLILALLFRGYEEHRRARDLRLRLSFTNAGEVDLHMMAMRTGNDLAFARARGIGGLSKPLALLKADLERTFGVSLKTDYDIERLGGRLQKLADLLADVDGHSAAMASIGHYLAAMPGIYGDLVALREQAIRAVEKVDAPS